MSFLYQPQAASAQIVAAQEPAHEPGQAAAKPTRSRHTREQAQAA